MRRRTPGARLRLGVEHKHVPCEPIRLRACEPGRDALLQVRTVPHPLLPKPSDPIVGRLLVHVPDASLARLRGCEYDRLRNGGSKFDEPVAEFRRQVFSDLEAVPYI